MSNAIQTSVELYPALGKLGGVYDGRETLAISRAAADNIRFGQACVYGTDPEKQAITPSATGQMFAGISIAHFAIEQTLITPPATSSGGYVVGSMVPLMRRGAIWVRVNVDVNFGDDVYFVYDNVDPSLIGNFRNDAGTSEADLVPSAKFIKSATAGNLAVIEINLP